MQSVIFYKKNWVNESKKQLEIAINMEPHNNKYSEAYSKLKQKIENRFSDHENGIENPFIDNFSAIIDFIEHNFTTINVEKMLVLW